MNKQNKALVRGASVLAVSAICAQNTGAQEVGNIATVEETVVVANRFPEEIKKLTESVTLISEEELAKTGSLSLQDLIGYNYAGVISTSTAGQRGQVGSLFVRGFTTDRVQLRVDGVRISDSNILLGNFLGAASPQGLGSVEILRGPQSSLYGGTALAGVVALSSAKGEGDPSLSTVFEGGSFDSFTASGEAQGELASGLAYRLGVAREETGNDLPGNDFEQTSYQLRLDQAIDGRRSVGLTLRGGESTYETPQFGPQTSDLDYVLGTLFYEDEVSDLWHTKVTLGYVKQDLEIDSAFPFETESEKFSVAFDNELSWNEAHLSQVGFIYEYTDFSSSLGVGDQRQLYGIYGQHTWQINEVFTLKGGLRWEDFDDFGDQVSWDIGGRADLGKGWALKANVGKAFRSPNFSELFGSDFTTGNPDLNAETSIGWDVGLEKEWGNGHKVALTWFENEVKDTINSPFFGTSENLSGRQKTSGLELAAQYRIEPARVNLRASYTYLEQALVEMPQQVVALSADWEVTARLRSGLSAQWVDERSFGGDALDDYFVVGLYANYELTERVQLTARVDNLFDEDYDLFSSFGTTYPARGRGVFGGVKISW